MYHVFLGAPSPADLKRTTEETYHWEHYAEERNATQQDVPLPPATLAAASRRISRLYKNIIFQDGALEASQQLEHGKIHPTTRGSRIFTR